MTILSWRITELERETADGYVFRVHYRIDADDNGIGESTRGALELPRPDAEMIPFEDLTPDQVVSWVQAALGAERIAAMYESLEEAVVAKANPVTAMGLPWSENYPVVVEPEPVRARNELGQFVADDPATPVDEAWVEAP